MRKFKGFEIDENMQVVGEAQFVVFGEMADGSKCYHKIIDGVEDDSCWYSRAKVQNHTVFIFEGC